MRNDRTGLRHDETLGSWCASDSLGCNRPRSASRSDSMHRSLGRNRRADLLRAYCRPEHLRAYRGTHRLCADRRGKGLGGRRNSRHRSLGCNRRADPLRAHCRTDHLRAYRGTYRLCADRRGKALSRRRKSRLGRHVCRYRHRLYQRFAPGLNPRCLSKTVGFWPDGHPTGEGNDYNRIFHKCVSGRYGLDSPSKRSPSPHRSAIGEFPPLRFPQRNGGR